MAKIILINPYPEYAHGINKAITITPPLGLAYLAAFLEQRHHKVQILDANILEIKSAIIETAFLFKPDLIGIQANIISYKAAIEVARRLKSLYPNTPILLGGPYSTSLPERILKNNPAVDAVVIGEGENTLLETAESLGKKNIFEDIKGLVWHDNGLIIRNDERSLIDTLDEIPFPAYHLLPNLKKYKTRSRGRPVGYLMTSRGCPFRCTFCNGNIFGKVWRSHSVGRVMDEIAYMVGHYGIKQIDIFDDNFTFDKKRATEILEQLARSRFKLYLNLQSGVSVDSMDEELLEKMKRAGVFKLALAIDTADETIQKNVKRNVDLRKGLLLARKARSLGMVTCGHFILGLPGDNAETMERTIAYALEMNPHHAHFMICLPFPGTEIFKEVKQRGEFLVDVETGVDAGFFGQKVFFRLDGMKPQEVRSYFQMAIKRFYLRPAKIIDVLRTIKSFGELQWLFNVVTDNNILTWRQHPQQ